MTIGAFITITRPEQRGDLYEQCFAMARALFDEVTIVDGINTWPKEFSWEAIGQHFQRGYEMSQTDWVFHLDTDFIFHENDYEAVKRACADNKDTVALSFWKYQFILPDRYNLKSRLVMAVNKAKYGDRIRFDSGGDLCQPSLDGKYIEPNDVPEARVAFYNYEKLIKTEAQIKDDVGRMARAWQRRFGDYKLGGPSDEDAYNEWLKMVVGRFNKPQQRIELDHHPEVMRDVIKNLRPEQWGYNGFNNLEDNDYVKSLRCR